MTTSQLTPVPQPGQTLNTTAQLKSDESTRCQISIPMNTTLQALATLLRDTFGLVTVPAAIDVAWNGTSGMQFHRTLTAENITESLWEMEQDPNRDMLIVYSQGGDERQDKGKDVSTSSGAQSDGATEGKVT